MARSGLGFLAAALAHAGVGFYSGKVAEEAKQAAASKHMIQQMLISSITKRAEQGEDVPDDVMRKAFGKDTDTVSALLGQMASSARDRATKQQAFMQEQLTPKSYETELPPESQSSAPPSAATQFPAPAQASAAPAQASASPMAALLNQLQPQAGPAPSGPGTTFEMPQAPPAAPAAPAAPLPQPLPVPQSMFTPQPTVGGTRSNLSEDAQRAALTKLFPRVGAVGRISSYTWRDATTGATTTLTPADANDPVKRGAALAGIGAERGFSYGSILQAAIQSGATLPPNFAQYGQVQFDRAYAGGARPKTVEEANDRVWEAYQQTGHMPDSMRQQLFPTKQTEDAGYAAAMQRAHAANPGIPYSVLEPAVRAALGGGVPSVPVVEQMRQQWGAEIESRLRAANPNISAAELEQAVQSQLGGGVMTEAERGRLDKPAALPADTAEQRTVEGKPTLLERQLRPVVRPGETPPPVEDLTETATRAAERKAAGAAYGREKAKDIDVVSKPEELSKYIDTQTGAPPEATSQTELDARVKKGSLAVLLAPLPYFKDIRTLRDRLEEVRSIVNDPQGVYALNTAQRTQLRLASGATSVNTLGIHATIPPLTALRTLGITEHQAEQAGKLLAVHAFAIPMLRQFGEKGQGITGKAYAQSADVFPGFLDDRKSAVNRLNEMLKWVDLDIKNSIAGPGAEKLLQADADRRFKEKFGGR